MSEKIRSAFVFNPDDEEDSFPFNGVVFRIPPNSTLEILPYGKTLSDPDRQVASPWDQHTPGEIAAHIEASLHMWGVRVVSGPVKDGEAKLSSVTQEEVDAAEDAYLRATLKWAEEKALAYHARSKPRKEAGLPDLQPSAEEDTAMRWLKKNAKRVEKLPAA